MIKLEIEWDQIRPALSYASGILSLYYVNTVLDKYELLLQCRVKKENGSTQYKSLDPNKGYNGHVFKKYEKIIQTIVDSYFDGMTVKKHTYNWIELE